MLFPADAFHPGDRGSFIVGYGDRQQDLMNIAVNARHKYGGRAAEIVEQSRQINRESLTLTLTSWKNPLYRVD